MKLLKLNQYAGTKILSTRLINSEMIMFVKRDNNIMSIKYFDGYNGSDYNYDMSFENDIDAKKYFDYVMEKLRAIKLEENPWNS